MDYKLVGIKKSTYDKERVTQYFNIEKISNWDLEQLWRLLEAEKQRARIVRGFNRGCEALLLALRELAKEREWEIPPENYVVTCNRKGEISVRKTTTT